MLTHWDWDWDEIPPCRAAYYPCHSRYVSPSHLHFSEARAGKGGFGGESEPECRHERIGALDFGGRGGVLELHTTPDFVMKHHFSQLIWIMHFIVNITP